MQGQSLASLSGLKMQCCHKLGLVVTDVARIWHCCGNGAGPNCSSDLTPSLGTSICRRCGHTKKKKKKGQLYSQAYESFPLIKKLNYISKYWRFLYVFRVSVNWTLIQAINWSYSLEGSDGKANSLYSLGSSQRDSTQWFEQESINVKNWSQ